MDFQPTGQERYLALDPGISTGYATFRDNGDLIRTGTLRNGAEELYPFLNLINPLVPFDVIVENYRLYPWKAMQQSWATLETVRFIGAVDFWAKQQGITVHLQDPNIKGIGYKWAGIKVPKNHDLSHETDAFVHGVYFLQKAGIRKPMQGKAVKS